MPRFALVAVFVGVACGGPARPSPVHNVAPPPATPVPPPVAAFTPTSCTEVDDTCVLRNYTGFKDEVCKCHEHDVACANRVTEGLTKWGSEMAKDSTKKRANISDTLMKQMADVAQQLAACMAKAMTPVDPPADAAGSAAP